MHLHITVLVILGDPLSHSRVQKEGKREAGPVARSKDYLPTDWIMDLRYRPGQRLLRMFSAMDLDWGIRDSETWAEH